MDKDHLLLLFKVCLLFGQLLALCLHCNDLKVCQKIIELEGSSNLGLGLKKTRKNFCPKNKILNHKTNRCIKKCRQGETRNKRNRCVSKTRKLRSIKS